MANATPQVPTYLVTTVHLLNLEMNCSQRLSGLPAVIGGFQISLTFFLNATLLFFILCRPKLRTKHSNRFYVNLQIVNILICGSVISGIVFVESRNEAIINNALLMTKFLCLTVKSGDRYTAINFPYKYEKLTTEVTFAIIACTWIPGLAYGVSGIFVTINEKELQVISSVLFLMSAVVLTASNVKIFLIARVHGARLKKNKNKMVLKSTYVCISIVLSFVLLWIPFFVHNILALIGVYKPACDKIFTITSVQIGLLNSLLDPILYVGFHKDAKTELRKSLKRDTITLNDERNRSPSNVSKMVTLSPTHEHHCNGENVNLTVDNHANCLTVPT